MKTAPMRPEELAAIRRKLGWSLEKLGERVGVTKMSIHRYENGKRRIPKAIAEVIRWVVDSRRAA
jgi:transcriptional regulator with XRE-family HTH domain